MKPQQERKPAGIIGNRGFTLIEVLVAIVVLTVGLLGMASLTISIIQGNRLSDDVTTATALAQDKMESIRNNGYAGLSSSDDETTEDYGSIPSYSQYKRVTNTAVNAPETDMKTVTITVYWDSNAHQVTMNSILTK